MKCGECETIYPERYSKCPRCGSKAKQKQKYAHRQSPKAQEAVLSAEQAVSAFVEIGELSAGEFKTF